MGKIEEKKTRVRKNSKIYKEKTDEEDLSKTKQQYFNFDTNTIENDNLNKRKRVKKEEKVIIEKKVYPKFLIFVLTFSLLLMISFCTYHFLTFNHDKERKVFITKKLDNNYLFLGDSITEQYTLSDYYKDMPVVNSGVGGNITKDILDDMTNRVYIYNPSKVFILIGTNDIDRKKTDDQIINNFEKIIKNIKKNRPSCEIYIESIYPVNGEDNKKIDQNMIGIRSNDRIKEINDKLKILASKLNVTYIDLYSDLIDKNGNLKLEYTKEGLHISDKGYKKITNILMKYIN